MRRLFLAPFLLGQIFSSLAFANLCSQELKVDNGGTSKKFQRMVDELGEHVIEQQTLIGRALVSLITDGNLLIEGPTGTGKTTTVKYLAQAINGKFTRTQFTSDTVPGEITGVSIYDQATKEFKFHEGTLFGDVMLADEINRAPSRVQSALLQGMEERQVTVGGQTIPLSKTALVLATQNPSTHAGTYPLTEASLDRFMLRVKVTQPSIEAEAKILEVVLKKKMNAAEGADVKIANQVSSSDILTARKEVLNMEMPPEVRMLILKLVDATRNPIVYNAAQLNGVIKEGVGPRATLALELGSRGMAWLQGHSRVQLSDVKAIAENALGHRLLLTEDALAEGLTPEKVVQDLIKAVENKK